MELKGCSGSMLSRVTLGLLLELLQDTVTSATRVPDTVSSLRVTTRGRSGRTGGRPQGPLTAHPAVLTELCSCTQAPMQAQLSLADTAGSKAPRSYLLL